MSKEFRTCQAPIHAEGCERAGFALTQDHFTPKSIIKLFNNGEDLKRDPDEYQWLSRACHIAKDRDTALRKEVLEKQLQGEVFDFQRHRAVFAHEDRI